MNGAEFIGTVAFGTAVTFYVGAIAKRYVDDICKDRREAKRKSQVSTTPVLVVKADPNKAKSFMEKDYVSPIKKYLKSKQPKDPNFKPTLTLVRSNLR